MSSTRYLALYRPADGGVYDASGFASAGFGTPYASFDQFESASGFSAGSFGAPSHNRAQPAAGFASGDFGTPFGRNIQVASGFTTSQFGATRIYPFNVGPGINSGMFGAPSGRQYWQAHALVMPGRFGVPFITFNRTLVASGFNSGRFGVPIKVSHHPPNTDVLCAAQSIPPGHFGTPRFVPVQEGAASSVGAGSFGTPKGRRVQRANGFSAAGFGSPTSKILTFAHGIGPGAFGWPTSRRVQQASSVYRAPRWGLATTERSNTHEAHSIYIGTRIGQPTGRIVRRASWFTSGAFGIPTASHIHRASSMAPTGSFGRPLLRRTTQC